MSVQLAINNIIHVFITEILGTLNISYSFYVY